MSGPDPAVMERLFDLLHAYADGDTDAWAVGLHPSVEWEIAEGVANQGQGQGPDEVIRSAETWNDAWADVRYEPREIAGEGSRVVIEMYTETVGQASGIPIDTTVWWAVELRDGQIVRGGIYPNRESAAARLGL
jgi:ketosteroid isomerase-like protein